jgi:hypothetical protein
VDKLLIPLAARLVGGKVSVHVFPFFFSVQKKRTMSLDYGVCAMDMTSDDENLVVKENSEVQEGCFFLFFLFFF